MVGFLWNYRGALCRLLDDLRPMVQCLALASTVDQPAADFGMADELGCRLDFNILKTDCQQNGDVHVCFVFAKQF
jgi:hypothetical protein